MTSNLENVIPGLRELRERERHNRALAFAGLTHTVCGVEVMPLTPRHRLNLQLMRNAFTVHGAEPQEGDVFVFLWLLSPARSWSFPGHHLAWNWLQTRLRRHVKRMVLADAVREIQLYLVSQLQDAPEAGLGEGSDFSAWIHWMGGEAGFWLNLHGGFTLESYLATPYLVLQQLRRMHQVNHPNISRDARGELVVEEPNFVNGSDRIASAWHRQHAAAIAEILRSKRERLPG